MPNRAFARSRIASRFARTLAAPALLLASACSLLSDAAGSGSAQVVVQDSAGVEIVEHSAAYIAALPVWTIDSVPSVRIRGDSPEHPFTDVVHARRRPDGRVVLFDVALRDLREFAATGDFLRILARQGRGPGEVGYVNALQELSNDTVVFLDGSRIVFVAGDRTPGAQYNRPRLPDGERVNLSTYMADGRVLARIRRPARKAEEAGGPVYRDSFAVVLLDGARGAAGDGNTPRVDTIAVLPDNEAYLGVTSEGDDEWVDEQPLRLGRATRIGSNGTRVMIGTNERHEFSEYGPSGLVRRIRNDRPARPISEADKQAFRDDVAAELERNGYTPDMLALMMVNVNRWRIADAHEFYSALEFGTDGTVWAEEPRATSGEARRYVVYDTLGHAVARAEFPAWLTPKEFSRTELLGVRRDENDVPHVMLWPLVSRP